MFLFYPTPMVEVADTVGAGDSFTAAFIASLLKGKSVVEAHSLAVHTSAYVCNSKRSYAHIASTADRLIVMMD